MDLSESTVEKVTMSEVLELATWERPRSTEELRNFISRRESIIAGK